MGTKTVGAVVLKEIPKSAAQIFETGFKIPCHIYACRKPIKYFIGRPDGPLNICMGICEDHMKELVLTLPEELRELLQEEEKKAPDYYTCPACPDSKFENQQQFANHLRYCKEGSKLINEAKEAKEAEKAAAKAAKAAAKAAAKEAAK